ncbi:MAG: mechanosensitive ion channel family protein [Geminicoccaceae bacterium]|nr:MAG: mechanosensitive ion channel family protein [Geminicoccaceae bacterium]
MLIRGAAAADASGITVTLPADLDPAVRAQVLETLGAAGASVAEPAPVAFDYGALTEVGSRLDAALEALPGALFRFAELLATYLSLWHVLIVVVALGLGLVVEGGVRRLGARPSNGEAPGDFRRRLTLALWPFGRDLLAIAGFVAVAFALGAVALSSDDGPGRTLLALSVNVVARMLVLLAIGRFLLAPGHPERRLAPLSDADAANVWRVLLATLLLLIPIRWLIEAFATALPTDPAAPLVLVLGEILAVAVIVTLFWRVRTPMSGLIEHAFGRGRGEPQSPLIGLFARSWHVFYSAIAVLRVVALAGEQFGAGLPADPRASGASFTILILLPFVIGGVDAWFKAAANGDRERTSGGLLLRGSLPALLKGVVLLLGVALIARSWGADPFAAERGVADAIAHALFHAGAAVLIGWALWQGVRAIIDYYEPLAKAAAQADAPGQELGETMGRKGSRLETLLPVLQSAAYTVIVVMSGLTALSALGVNIGPLLAGAGVVGLAIGFGAQTLVRDIITGMFYLMEDAFRVGEYIVCGAGKGMVEKISLRSVRLRHHRGPVYTIPFGSMGTVQNHSRDWVKLKLMLRVPLDVDLELVRKTVKKVGTELAADEQFKDQFLEPVKSQGVVDVDDSAFIIAVKFVCRPGQQFVLRRHAYAKIQEAFQKAGIEFAPRKVIVGTETHQIDPSVAGAGASAAVPPVAAN